MRRAQDVPLVGQWYKENFQNLFFCEDCEPFKQQGEG